MPESCSLFDTLHTVEFPRQDGCVINGNASSDFSRVRATKAPRLRTHPHYGCPHCCLPRVSRATKWRGFPVFLPLEIDERWLAIGMKTYKGVASKYALGCKALQNFL